MKMRDSETKRLVAVLLSLESMSNELVAITSYSHLASLFFLYANEAFQVSKEPVLPPFNV